MATHLLMQRLAGKMFSCGSSDTLLCVDDVVRSSLPKAFASAGLFEDLLPIAEERLLWQSSFCDAYEVVEAMISAAQQENLSGTALASLEHWRVESFIQLAQLSFLGSSAAHLAHLCPQPVVIHGVDHPLSRLLAHKLEQAGGNVTISKLPKTFFQRVRTTLETASTVANHEMVGRFTSHFFPPRQLDFSQGREKLVVGPLITRNDFALVAPILQVLAIEPTDSAAHILPRLAHFRRSHLPISVSTSFLPPPSSWSSDLESREVTQELDCFRRKLDHESSFSAEALQVLQQVEPLCDLERKLGEFFLRSEADTFVATSFRTPLAQVYLKTARAAGKKVILHQNLSDEIVQSSIFSVLGSSRCPQVDVDMLLLNARLPERARPPLEALFRGSEIRILPEAFRPDPGPAPQKTSTALVLFACQQHNYSYAYLDVVCSAFLEFRRAHPTVQAQLLIRPHPVEFSWLYRAWNRQEGADVVVSKAGSVKELLNAATVFITSHSMTAFEAVCAEKPVAFLAIKRDHRSLPEICWSYPRATFVTRQSELVEFFSRELGERREVGTECVTNRALGASRG